MFSIKHYFLFTIYDNCGIKDEKYLKKKNHLRY